MQYDGSDFVNISEPIKKKLLAELNREAAFKSVLQWHDDKLYVSIPIGTQSTAVNSVTYVYDTELKVWTRWDYGMVPTPFPMYTDLATTGPSVALSNNMFGGTPSKGVFEFNSGKQDDGSAISSFITTPWMNMDSLGARYRLRRFDLLADDDDEAITIDIYTDLEADVAKLSLTWDPSDGTENSQHMTQIVDNFFWQWLAFKFTQNGDQEDMNLFGWGASVSARQTPRGTIGKTGYTPT